MPDIPPPTDADLKRDAEADYAAADIAAKLQSSPYEKGPAALLAWIRRAAAEKARADAAEAEVARLRRLLGPFATIARAVDSVLELAPPNPCVGQMLDVRIDNMTLVNMGTVDDCRAAAKALDAAKGG